MVNLLTKPLIYGIRTLIGYFRLPVMNKVCLLGIATNINIPIRDVSGPPGTWEISILTA